MSALEPVILNEVKQAKLMIQAVSDSAGTTTVSIPVRQGHSFADGDIALYDTERGDLHDGRGEFYAYFSPESGGASYVAHSATPSGYHERDDGSFVILITHD